MNKDEEVKISKYLSYVLRHNADGYSMDANGWVAVTEFTDKPEHTTIVIDTKELEQVVKNNNKQRFEFNEDHTKIRARQGHTLKVDLQFEEKEPPTTLFHGTTYLAYTKFIKGNGDGLKKMKRHHVHLSPDVKTALPLQKGIRIHSLSFLSTLQ